MSLYLCSMEMLHIVYICLMQGAGKTSLLKAMLGQVKERNSTVLECIHVDLHGKGISNGLCYIDSTTVNLQVLLLPFFSRKRRRAAHHYIKKGKVQSGPNYNTKTKPSSLPHKGEA